MAHSFMTQSWTLASFFASALGMFLLYNHSKIRNEDLNEAQWMLFAMSFAYWIVHCIAISTQPWVPQEWAWVLLSLKFCSVLSALLTFSSAFSLPISNVSEVNKVEEDFY